MQDLVGPWLNRLPDLREQFDSAEPFPHVVVDEFLVADFAERLHGEFPSIGEMPKSRDYMFGDKHELSSLELRGPASLAYHELLLSPEFASVLQEICGRDVFVDPAHHGGGFHQGTDGSFLDTHVDFNVHPLQPTWLRVLNILLYISPNWQPEYDGALLIRRDPTHQPKAILPQYNRAVIMLTSDVTYHGYRRMSLPPGISRKSIATYAYEEILSDSVVARTTQWVPDEGGMKKLIARGYGPAVKVKNRLFGSRTARNR